MKAKRIGIIIAIVVALGLSYIVYKQIIPSEYVPADDEIAIHIQLNIEEDIGLLVFDYRANDAELSGGISNADKSLIKHNSDVVLVWNKQELGSSSDAIELSIQFRLITEYVNPNYENIYPEDITEHLDAISWKAHFGETYFVTITSDEKRGYKAIMN